ncbi:MAG: phosphate/phosphite/phosphonate ABC transporter substrate-binding protein [Thiogranum sp.]
MIFYINSHVFYRLQQDARAVGVAQMQNIAGEVTSRSEIYVRADSGIESVEQLNGKRIAFISPMGAGGYLAPRAYLHNNGVMDSQEIFTRNLSSSIHQVLLRDVEAGTMCGVNYRLMSQKIDTGELRIIGASEAYPENLIAAHSNLDPALLERIRTVILDMEKTPAGSKVLEQMHSMKIRRFLPYDPASVSMTEKLLEEAQLKP